MLPKQRNNDLIGVLATFTIVIVFNLLLLAATVWVVVKVLQAMGVL